MTDTKQYAKRNPETQGEHYIKHVSAMTTEDLHKKSEVAAELAHRDILINALKEELKRSNKQLYKMVYALGSALDGQQHHEIHELGLTYADCELVWESLSEARMVLRENNWITPNEYNLKERP